MRLNVFVKALLIGLLLTNAEDGDGENDQQDTAALEAPPTPAPAPPPPNPSTATEPSGRQCSESSEERLENIMVEPIRVTFIELDELQSLPINNEPPLPHLRESLQQEVNSTFKAEGIQNNDCSVEMRVMHLIDAVRSMIVFTEDFWMEWLAEVVESTTLSRHARREEMLNLHGLLSSQVKQLLESLKQDIMPPFGVGGCDRGLLFTFLDELDRMLRWVRATASWVCEDVAQGQTLYYDESESLAEAAPPRPNRQENNGQSSGYCFNELRISIPEGTYSDAPTTRLPPRSGNLSEYPDADKPWQSHLQQKIEGAQTSLKATLTALNAVLQPTEGRSESLEGQPIENRIGGPYVDEVKFENRIPTESSRSNTTTSKDSEDDSSGGAVSLGLTEQSAALRIPINSHPPLPDHGGSLQNEEISHAAELSGVLNCSAEVRVAHLIDAVRSMAGFTEDFWFEFVTKVMQSTTLSREARREEMLNLHGLLSRDIKELLKCLKEDLLPPVLMAGCNQNLIVTFLNELSRMLRWLRNTGIWISEEFPAGQTHSSEDLVGDSFRLQQNWRARFGYWSRSFFNFLRHPSTGDAVSIPSTRIPPTTSQRYLPTVNLPDSGTSRQSYLQQDIAGAEASVNVTLHGQEWTRQATEESERLETSVNVTLNRDVTQVLSDIEEFSEPEPTQDRFGEDVNPIPVDTRIQYTRAPEEQDDEMRVSVVLDVTEQSATMTPITCHSHIQRCDDNSEHGANDTNTAAPIEVVDTSLEERTTRIRQLVENVIVWMEESWWARVLEVVSSPLINDTNRKDELQSLHRLLSCHVRDLLTVLERELRSSVDVNVYDPAMEVPFVNEMAQMVQCVRYTTTWISENFFNPTQARNFNPEALENLRQGAIRPPTWRETYRYSQTTTLQLSASSLDQVNMVNASRRLSDAGRSAPNIEQPVAHSSQRMPLRLEMEGTSESLRATSSGQHATFEAMEICEDDSDLSEDSTCCPYLARMLNRIFSFQWCLAAFFCHIFPSTKK